LVDLGKSEYENMSGRAGRLAFTADFGRSIMVTHSRYQAENWLETYVGPEFEDIVPTSDAIQKLGGAIVAEFSQQQNRLHGQVRGSGIVASFEHGRNEVEASCVAQSGECSRDFESCAVFGF
jgi:hypothetical protein